MPARIPPQSVSARSGNLRIGVLLGNTWKSTRIQRILREKDGGAEGIRTPDPHNAIVVLYQLSYDPKPKAGRTLLGLSLIHI